MNILYTCWLSNVYLYSATCLSCKYIVKEERPTFVFYIELQIFPWASYFLRSRGKNIELKIIFFWVWLYCKRAKYNSQFMSVLGWRKIMFVILKWFVDTRLLCIFDVFTFHAKSEKPKVISNVLFTSFNFLGFLGQRSLLL